MLVHVRTGMWIDNLKITGLRAGAPHKALAEIHTSPSAILSPRLLVYRCDFLSSMDRDCSFPLFKHVLKLQFTLLSFVAF